MKIKNEYIKINVGNKTFIKKNMILDVYLKQIFNSQINDDHDTSTIHLCFIKFDTPIENIEYNSDVDPKDYFDVILVSLRNYNAVVKTSNNIVKLIYNFDSALNFMYYNGTEWISRDSDGFNKFVGKQITALGFGSDDKLFSFLDTRNMNIFVNYNEQIKISKVDSIQSDGIVKGYDYPLHLVQDVINKTVLGRENKICAQLYSVGFGNVMGLMEEEYLLSNFIHWTTDTAVEFLLIRRKKIGHYPSENLQLGFYPTMDNSKYLIFKYRLYKRELVGSTHLTTYLNKYYTMNMANTDFDGLNVKLKIERM